MSKVANNPNANIVKLKAKNKQELFYNELLLSNPGFFYHNQERKSNTPNKYNCRDLRGQLKSPSNQFNGIKKTPGTTKNQQYNDMKEGMIINCLMNRKKKMEAQRKSMAMRIKSPTSNDSNRNERPLSNSLSKRRSNSKDYSKGKIPSTSPSQNILLISNQSKEMLFDEKLNSIAILKYKENSAKSQNINKKDKNKSRSHSKSKSQSKSKSMSKSKEQVFQDHDKENRNVQNKQQKEITLIPKTIQQEENKPQENQPDIKEKDLLVKTNQLIKENSAVNLVVNKDPKPKVLHPSSSQPDLLAKKPMDKKVIAKIDMISKTGFSGPGVKKVNQDSYFIFKNLNDEPDTLYIGVCDGHGLVGHDVSKYLITHLPKNIHEELKKTKKYISNKETRDNVLKSTFISTNKQLCATKDIDTDFSGSTCVTIILKKRKVISANTGDSRAVLGRCCSDGNWVGIDLSHDHKPSDPIESQRIINHGGRIESYKDENGGPAGPARVWLQKKDIPGLAMSRSFGDEVAASVGTISEPEILEFDLTPEDKFIIIASDGIWEFISSTECVNIVKDYYLKNDISGCLTYLLNEASKRWIKEEEVIDDITCVIVFFEK